MTQSLSEQDISALLESAAGPEVAAQRLGRSVAQSSLTEEERQVAEAVLRRLAGHASIRVREAIAETLHDSPYLPHDIARRLIADVESVALPVLRFSPIVTSEDLVEVVRSGGTEKQIAVASRREVPAVVAEALVETDNNRAVATLVANPGAVLDEKALERVAGKFGSDPAVSEVLEKHPRVSAHVAERLRQFGANSLTEYLRRHPDLPEPLITQMVLRTLDEMAMNVITEHSEGEAVRELVGYLCRAGRLSPSLILRAICTGDLELYELAMAALAGIPVENARVLIYDAGPLGLKSLHEKAGMPPRFLGALRNALEILRETFGEGREWGRREFQRAMLERILSDPEVLDEADADYLLVRLNSVRQ
jgi:uncharacterized protein (DUF2336 family)